MQKLISIWVCDGLPGDCEEKEHLRNYLADGWRIVQMTPLDGNGGGETTDGGGWVFVLLEKTGS